MLYATDLTLHSESEEDQRAIKWLFVEACKRSGLKARADKSN